jgi:hypothetical protein
VPRLTTAIALALLALLCLQVASAEAGFAPENDTIPTAEFGSVSGIASDSQGDTLVAWTEFIGPTEVAPRARWVSAAGQLGPPIDPSSGGTGFEPVVAMAPSGRAFVAWRDSEGSGPSSAFGRWVERDGSMGPLLTIAVGEPAQMSAVELHVVVDPAGVATAAWRNGEPGKSQDLNMRRIQPDSSMSPAIPEIAKGVVELDIAPLPNGSTVAVWRDIGISEAVLTGNLEVVPETQISSDNRGAGPDVATDGLGNGLVAWRGEPGEDQFTVLGRRLDSSGGPLEGELGIEPAPREGVSIPLEVSADSADDFMVTWSERLDLSTFAVAVRSVNSAGAFTGAVQPLTPPGSAGAEAKTALLDSGTGAVVWEAFFGMSSSAFARTIGPTGLPSSDPFEIAPKTSFVVSSAVPAAGFAAFAVSQREGVVVRRFLEPPACRPVSVTLRTAKPTPVPLDCSGLGIETGQAVRGPKHGKLGPIDVPARSVLYTPRGGDDSFTYLLANDGGAAQPVEVTLADRARPKIKRLRLLKKKKRGGFRFLVKVSEPARIKLTVARRGGGRGKRVVGRLKSSKPKRKSVIKVRGRLARKLLAGGRFRAAAVATDLARNKSRPKRLRIRLKG